MSASRIAGIEEPIARGLAEVRPFEATDTDLPAILWPEGEVPASVARQSAIEEARRTANTPRLASLAASSPVAHRNNATNCSRSRRATHWYRQTRLGWRDGYRILLGVEARLWEARERISEVQNILDSCRRLVLAEMGYRVS